AVIEGVIRGIVDEVGIVGADGKERAVAGNQHGVEPLIHSTLPAAVAIEVFGGVKRIMGFGHVMRQKGRILFRGIPLTGLHVFRKLLAVHTDLPRQEAGGVNLGFAVQVNRGFVTARQLFEGELSVLVKFDEVVVAFVGMFVN